MRLGQQRMQEGKDPTLVYWLVLRKSKVLASLYSSWIKMVMTPLEMGEIVEQRELLRVGRVGAICS